MNFHLGKEARRWILGIVLGVIIVSFIFFYGYSANEGSQESYRDQLNDPGADEGLARQLQQQAFNALVQRAFLLQMARKYRIEPSPFEVLVSVANMPEMRTEEGHFNDQLFQRLPQYYKRRLERDRRNELTINLLEVRIANAAKVPDNEVREQFDLMNTKVRVAYVFEESDAAAGADLLVPMAPSGGKIERVLDRVRAGQDLSSAGRAEGLAVDATDLFFFGGRIPLAGRSNQYASALEGNAEFYKTAFSMKKGMMSPVLNVRGGRCVFAVLDYKEPDWSRFPSEAEGVRAQVQGQKMNDYFSAWFSENIQTARIQNNLHKLFGE